jgi:hypothetical protein
MLYDFSAYVMPTLGISISQFCVKTRRREQHIRSFRIGELILD